MKQRIQEMFVIRNFGKMMKALLAIGMLCCMSTVVRAAVVENGHFAGLDLIPMQGTRMSQLDAEPATVLIFGADSKSVDVTSRFDSWFRSSTRPKVNVYAVSVGQPDTPFDVISEVLHQRSLLVPVFHTRTDLLKGEDYRLILLDHGGQVRRAFKGLDLTALEDELLGRPPSTPVAGASATGVSTTTLSIDGGAAMTPTPMPGQISVEEVPTGPQYRNKQFELMVDFPPTWPYRVARSGDGAVAKSPLGGRLDLRVWALPNDTDKSEAPGRMTASEYIDQSLRVIGETNQTNVRVERRLGIEDDGVDGSKLIDGRDVIYNYKKLIDPANPAAGSLRYRGRMQVFEAGNLFKAAGAEGPTAEYDGAQAILEPFFTSFRPVLLDESAAVPPPGAAPGATPVQLPRDRVF